MEKVRLFKYSKNTEKFWERLNKYSAGVSYYIAKALRVHHIIRTEVSDYRVADCIGY